MFIKAFSYDLSCNLNGHSCEPCAWISTYTYVQNIIDKHAKLSLPKFKRNHTYEHMYTRTPDTRNRHMDMFMLMFVRFRF